MNRRDIAFWQKPLDEACMRGRMRQRSGCAKTGRGFAVVQMRCTGWRNNWIAAKAPGEGRDDVRRAERRYRCSRNPTVACVTLAAARASTTSRLLDA
jgi:hypothetical protein